ncbi:MAG: prepilin-type N-terminal cleavage/methylation domain-containing protein [Sedimentisphaerales bacterium]|nr:prepilin-type N-terminal cleavage/methylation domain-containing protein [Sedimentisphaerales bacterium]
MARRGLTLIELLVVVGVITLLLALSFPALMRARNQAQGAVCAQNQKILALAWLLYKDDNDDRLVGGSVGHPYDWVQGPTGVGTAIDRQKEGIRQGALYRYTGDKVEVFRCPADQRKQMPGQMAYRSYSIAGGANGEGWQYTFTPAEKYSEIVQYGTKYVFVEEADPRGWNKGSWVLNPLGETWVDPLAVWHSRSRSTLGYADGHAEIHRWVDQSTIGMSERQEFFCPVPPNEGEDLRFMIGGFPQKSSDASKNGRVG